MNRREALAAFAAVPSVASLGTIKLAENDPDNPPLFAVLECPGRLSESAYFHLKQSWFSIFDGEPPFKLIILDNGAHLKLCRNKAD